MYKAYGNIASACSEVDFARRSVPFFAETLAGLPGSGAKGADLFRNVPLTTKADYRKNFPGRILAKGRSVNDAYVSRLQSSGTSGDRLISVIHSFKLADRMANCLSLNRDLLFLQEAAKVRTCRYAAPNCSDVECSNPNVTMDQRILPDGTLVLPVFHDLLTTPKPMLRQAFDELHSYEPNLWYLDPMHLAFLIKKAREWGWTWEIDPNRKLGVLLTYTLATQALLRQIDGLCGGRFPVASVLGMSEFGYVGLGCHEGTLHLNDQDYFLEFMRVETESAANQLWELAITSVGDRLCPHIRYNTNDIYRLMPEPCACGNAMPAVSFEGRRKDLVPLASGKIVTPKDLDRAVGAPAWIDIFQLTFQRPDTFILRYSGDASCFVEEEGRALKDRLGELLESSTVRIEVVQYFPFERGGKFQLIRTSGPA